MAPSPLLETAGIMREVRIQELRPSPRLLRGSPTHLRQRVWRSRSASARSCCSSVRRSAHSHARIASTSLRTGCRPCHRAKSIRPGRWPRARRRMAPSVTFVPDSAGNAEVTVPADPATTAAAAISVEPVGGSKQPTTRYPSPVIPIHKRLMPRYSGRLRISVRKGKHEGSYFSQSSRRQCLMPNIVNEPTRFSGSCCVYSGAPALPVTLSMVIAGGGPSNFNTVTLLKTLTGSQFDAEVTKLDQAIRQGPSRAVSQDVRLCDR